jgi:alpha-galactosidase
MGNIHSNNAMAPVVNGGQGAKNGQGNFNDADMLEIGNVGLTVTEQYSMMSLWSIAGSPLLAGTDIIHATPTTIKILANKEVTAINQDLGA